MKNTKSEHTKYYNSNGKEVPSCTNIVKLLNKPELVGWANYMGFRKIDVSKFLNEKAQYGTNCHIIAESYMTGIVLKEPDISHNMSQFEYDELLGKLIKLQNAFNSLNIQTVFTEMELHGARFGGTLDLLCRNTITGSYTLFDYKTSKNVYDSHLIQLAGYSMLLEELYGISVDHIGIILLSKNFEDDNFINIIKRTDNVKNEKIFNKLLEIYWIQHE